MRQMSVMEAAEVLQPVKKYINECWNSPKRYHVFCLVEGSFDKHIYEDRLNKEEIEVKIAADDQLHHNRNSVKYLVEDLYKIHPNGRYIGIRDKDYMMLLGQTCPAAIYTTDHRDLEMTIFAADSFRTAEPWIIAYLEEVLPHCLQMAYLRVYAENKGLQRKVSDSLNVAVVYNQKEREYMVDTKATLFSKYIEKIDNLACEADIENFIADNELSSLSPYDMCRGHDVVGLMEFVHGNAYSRQNIENKMEQHYSAEDFYASNLFSSIQNYCDKFGIDAKKVLITL